MTVAIPDPVPSRDDEDAVFSGRGVADGVALSWGSASRRGAARSNNQDSHLALPPVFAVADGMGGHAAGDQASRCVVDALRTLVGLDGVTSEDVHDRIVAARTAMGRIEFDSEAAPGSTLSGVLLTRDRRGRPCWMVVNVGDSRVYRWDGRNSTRLTDDHTVAAELVQRGASAAAAARWNAFLHKLTRAVVADVEHEPDVWLVPVGRGDRLLACSDGVHGVLDDPTIADVLRSAPDPAGAAVELVDRVAALGGRDDATAVVVDAGSAGSGWA